MLLFVLLLQLVPQPTNVRIKGRTTRTDEGRAFIGSFSVRVFVELETGKAGPKRKMDQKLEMQGRS